MFLVSIFLSGLGLAYIVSGIPVDQDGYNAEISGREVAVKLAVRDVTNLPTALITCRKSYFSRRNWSMNSAETVSRYTRGKGSRK